MVLPEHQIQPGLGVALWHLIDGRTDCPKRLGGVTPTAHGRLRPRSDGHCGASPETSLLQRVRKTLGHLPHGLTQRTERLVGPKFRL